MDALLLVAIGAGVLAAGGVGLWWSERRRRTHLQREVDELRVRAEQAHTAREAFFDLVTHELRSPLSAILGYQELLADGAYGGLGSAAAQPIHRIGRSARHLLHLIDGVVELSRIRAGGTRLDLGTVNLGVLLGSVTEAFELIARERHTEYEIARHDDPLPTIRSDQDRLVGALDLMITSALKHPSDGPVRLSIRAADGGADVHVDGTDLETRSDAEDPAVRLGIRLAVAAGMADALGGGLDLDEDPGGRVRGMTFRIRESAPH